MLCGDGFRAVHIFSSERRGLDEIPSGTDVVILPVPFSRDGTTLNAPLYGDAIPLSLLDPYLAGRTVIGGAFSEDFTTRLTASGSVPFDLLRREEFAVLNAIATAEGAVALAISSTQTTLHSSECLVTGRGRIARLLADRLRAFGAHVTVAARKPSDLVWISAAGMRPIHISEIGADRYDIIFNTVPALVLTGESLARCRGDCLIIELASAPGGVDRAAAERLGVRIIDAPGLPGKVAPVSAAAAIEKTVLNILKEQNI